jgi:hypothetical protein
MAQDIRVRTYRGATQEQAALQFQQDAMQAAAAGYDVLSQAWEGPVLTVTYRRRAASPVSDERAGVSVAGAAVLLGGIGVVVGSFLPWITVSSAFTTVSRSGIDGGGDGVITLVIGALIAVCGVFLATGRKAVAAWAAGLVLGLAAAGIGILDAADVQERIEGVGSAAAMASTGAGLYVVIVGGVLAALASVAVPIGREPGVRSR